MSDLVERINEYLANGGLFNPELMDHKAASQLLVDCRSELTRLRKEVAKWREAAKPFVCGKPGSVRTSQVRRLTALINGDDNADHG